MTTDQETNFDAAPPLASQRGRQPSLGYCGPLSTADTTQTSQKFNDVNKKRKNDDTDQHVEISNTAPLRRTKKQSFLLWGTVALVLLAAAVGLAVYFTKSPKETVCRFNDDNGTYESIVLDRTDVLETDSKGQCIGGDIVNATIIKDIPDASGVEQKEGYQITYNITYTKADIVALAASKDRIQRVICRPESVEIVFSNPLESKDVIDRLFPESSVLAVDGTVFGQCNVAADSQDTNMASGFLVIQSAQRTESADTITVSGDAVTFNYLFKERDIVYEPTNHGRRLLGLEGTEHEKLTKKFLEDPLSVTIGIEASTYASLYIVRDYWSLFGGEEEDNDEWWGGDWWTLDPYIDYSLEFSTHTNITVGLDIAISHKETLWELPERFKEIDFIPPIPIPYVRYELPSAITTALKKAVPELDLKAAAGVAIKIPAAFDAKLLVDFSFSFGPSFTVRTGEKVVRFSVRGSPSLDNLFDSLDVDFEMPVNEEPSSEKDFKLSDVTDVSGGINLTMFAGVAPQIVIDAVGLADASLGFYTGVDLNTRFEIPGPLPAINETGLPYEVFCDSCHNIETDLDIVVARDPFFRYKLLLDKTYNQKPLLEHTVPLPLLKFCFLTFPEKTCGDQCCEAGETCLVDDEGSNICQSQSCDMALPGIDCCFDPDCDNELNRCIENKCIVPEVTQSPIDLPSSCSELSLTSWASMNPEAFDWISSQDSWRPPDDAVDAEALCVERYALASLYFGTYGDNWFNNDMWLAATSVCDWYGVVCSEDRISELNLGENSLMGNIPEAIELLEGLRTLDLFNNNLSGGIPEWIGSLTSLETLALAWNGFSGSLPESIGSLSNLEMVYLAYVGVSGSIPDSVGSMTSLTSLDLAWNQLTGTIPQSIGSLPNLQKLHLPTNFLTGSIPTTIRSLTSLNSLHLHENFLTGIIPPFPHGNMWCLLASTDLGLRGVENNCFSDTSNAPNSCDLELNCSN